MYPSDNLQASRPKRNPDDNLIPLINIVFLLLIFFMVAGQIGSQDAVAIDSPASTSRAPLDAATLEFSLDAEGTLREGGQVHALEELRAMLRTASEAGEPTVVLHADRTATAETLDAVFAILRDEGISSLRLRTRLEETP